MKAVICTGKSKLEVIEMEKPKISGDQVLVRMKVSGICGSDVERYHFPEALRNPETNEIVVTGHEPTGIVEEIGRCVTNLKIGDRVMIYHKMGCGKCKYCLEGRTYFCKDCNALAFPLHGACAEYVSSDALNCLKLPEDFTFEDGAVMSCGGGTGFEAIKKIDISGTDTVAVVGMGPVGLASLITAKARGAKIIAIDFSEKRLNLAKSWGADYTICNKDDKLVENAYNLWEREWIPAMQSVKEVYDVTNGEGANAVVISTDNIQARINGIYCAAKESRVVTVGMLGEGVHEEFQQVFNAIAFRELKVFGTNVWPISNYFEMIDFFRKHQISIGKIVTHKYPIDDAEEAFKMAASQDTGKVALVF